MPTYTTNYNIPKPLVNDPQDEDLWGDYLNDGLDIIDSTMASISGGTGGVPAGCGMDYWGTSAPSGWLFAYGQAVSRTTYAALFAAIGTTFGAGDGSTTFNLPDKRGRSSFGKDDMGGTSANRLTNQSGGVNGDVLGAVGGAETHTLTTAELAAHSHTGTTDSSGSHSHGFSINYSPTITASGTNAATTSANAGTLPWTTAAAGDHTHTFTTANSGSGSAHNNIPPAIICNYIIKT